MFDFRSLVLQQYMSEAVEKKPTERLVFLNTFSACRIHQFYLVTTNCARLPLLNVYNVSVPCFISPRASNSICPVMP